MNKKYTILTFLAFLAVGVAFAGNPDRQGEAGAYELLINPWARSAGLHTLNVASISGVEAMGLNVAGLGRTENVEIRLANTQYVSDLQLNTLGLSKRIGNGSFGLMLKTMSFGEIQTTTVDAPEGTGATFSPNFTTVGLMYGHEFENKVSVGVGVKFVNESISNASASGFAIDAGVQYVTGEDDRFKFGISLRNIGSRMSFRGEGLSQALESPTQSNSFNLTYYVRTADFELPSQLNIGASYDWPIAARSKLTVVSSFISNAFSQDQLGAGVEVQVNDYLAFRAAYKSEFGKEADSIIKDSFDNGFSGGFSTSFKAKKESDMRIGLDYAYRTTKVFNGIHNLSLSFAF